MPRSTPEYVAAHLQGLPHKRPKLGPEPIARHRHAQRRKRALFFATILRPIPFTTPGEAKVKRPASEGRPALPSKG